MKTRTLQQLTLALLLAVVLAPEVSAESWFEPPEEPGAEQELTDLEKIGKERRLRARLYPPQRRVSRYMEAAVEATDEGEPQRAEELLAKLNPNRLNPNERALLYRLWAYISYSAGDTQGAIDNFQKVLDQQIVRVEDEARIRFNIAQLYAGQQNWPETIAAIDRWLPWTAQPDPLGFYLKAIAYYQLDQLEESIPFAEKAIDLSPEPREGWLQLLAALYVQKEDYANATPVLEELVIRFPKKLYWVQLALIYGARENYQHSLAVQQVAYAQGLLTENSGLRRLARSYLYGNLPYQAGEVLDQGLQEGSIEPDAKAYEMLANSWIAAREYERSLPPLRRAADLSEKGTLYVRLGQVHLQREDWAAAAAMLEKGIAKGELDNPGGALVLLGISHYNLDRITRARSYFARALQHEKSRPEAKRWLKHLVSEAQTADADAGQAANPT